MIWCFQIYFPSVSTLTHHFPPSTYGYDGHPSYLFEAMNILISMAMTKARTQPLIISHLLYFASDYKGEGIFQHF